MMRLPFHALCASAFFALVSAPASALPAVEPAGADAAVVGGWVNAHCHDWGHFEYCYDYDTNQLCVSGPAAACTTDVPFVDEDDVARFFFCNFNELWLIPDIPPQPCLP